MVHLMSFRLLTVVLSCAVSHALDIDFQNVNTWDYSSAYLDSHASSDIYSGQWSLDESLEAYETSQRLWDVSRLNQSFHVQNQGQLKNIAQKVLAGLPLSQSLELPSLKHLAAATLSTAQA